MRAYYEQYQRDFSLFLKCRAEELVEGGRMILTIMGRRSDDPSSKDGCYIWEIMATALNDMVLQVQMPNNLFLYPIISFVIFLYKSENLINK